MLDKPIKVGCVDVMVINPIGHTISMVVNVDKNGFPFDDKPYVDAAFEYLKKEGFLKKSVDRRGWFVHTLTHKH